LVLAFLASESRTKSPLVPRSLLRNGPVVQANLAAAAGFGSFIAFVFLTSVMMQQLLGYSPTKTGLAWLFTTVVAFFCAGATGAVLAQKVGARILLGAASVLIVAAAAWLALLPAHASFGRVIPALIAAGIAVGFYAPSVQIGALTDVAETDFGAASGAVETSRELGGAVAIAAASSVLLGSHTGLLHGMHSAYVVIAIGAGLGVLATVLRVKSRRRDPLDGLVGAEASIQRATS
jgi:MFS family permease